MNEPRRVPPRVAAMLAALSVASPPSVARADDVVGMSSFLVGGGTSRSNVTSGEGATVLAGWRTDVAIGSGFVSYRGGLDAMLGGGDHVFARRLGITVLPGARLPLGDTTAAVFRLGVEGRSDVVTSFSARHLTLPSAELGFRWQTGKPADKASSGAAFDFLSLPSFGDWLSGLAASVVGLMMLLDPERREAVSLDLSLHGGLALGGRWGFSTIADDARTDVAGASTPMSPSAALGANMTLAVRALQLRASYTGFHGSDTVHEFRGSLCGALFIAGACLDGLVLRTPTPGSPSGHDHATGVAIMASLGLVLASHGAL